MIYNFGMRIVVFRILLSIYLMQLDTAFGFAPNQQEACCLAIVQNTPSEGSDCRHLNLTPQVCVSVVAGFTRAAQLHTKNSQSIQDPDAPKTGRNESGVSLGTPIPSSKPSSFSKSDTRVIFVFVALCFLGIVLFVMRKRLPPLGSIFAAMFRTTIVLVNVGALVWIASMASLKILCSIGDQCRTTTVMVVYLFPSALIGMFSGFSYLKSSWRKRGGPWTKDLVMLSTLVAIICMIYLMQMSIP